MDAERLERAIDLAYGKAFGIGPMPKTSRDWFDLGFRAALAAQPAQAGEAVARAAAVEALRLVLEQVSGAIVSGRQDVVSNEAIVRRAVAHALRAQRPGGAAQEQAGEAVGHVHDWDYDCRGSGPFCKLCGVGPSRPGGAA